MSISRRLRFEILRRDNYACRYCGARAPEVPLTVDHVVPRALGGTDDHSNLATSCEPCNIGKGSSVPDATIVAEVAATALRWADRVIVAENPVPAVEQQFSYEALMEFFPASVRTDAERNVAENIRQGVWGYSTDPGRREQAAVVEAIVYATTDLYLIHKSVIQLLDLLPDDIGTDAQRAARISLYNDQGATFTRSDFVDLAVSNARDILAARGVLV